MANNEITQQQKEQLQDMFNEYDDDWFERHVRVELHSPARTIVITIADVAQDDWEILGGTDFE